MYRLGDHFGVIDYFTVLLKCICSLGYNGKVLYTRSVQKVSDLFLSRQQGMSKLPVQSVAAHTRVHA